MLFIYPYVEAFLDIAFAAAVFSIPMIFGLITFHIVNWFLILNRKLVRRELTRKELILREEKPFLPKPDPVLVNRDLLECDLAVVYKFERKA